MKIKTFFCLLAVSFFGSVVFAEDTRELQMSLHKKHRLMRHEEAKKWGAMKEECRKKFPNWYKTSHPDYDGEFKCREEIADAEKAFDDKLQDELCQNISSLCRK